MEKEEIKFGTDGWRGIISADFTMEKVRMVTRGVCNYLKKKKGTSPQKSKVVIGYDTRFLSGRFAAEAAGVFSASDVKVLLSDRFVPTPVVSNAVLKEKADLGIMITASHNPYYYNGYKIKGPFGGSATMDIISDVEKEVNLVLNDRNSYMGAAEDGIIKGKNIKKVDFTGMYIDHAMNMIEPEVLRGFDFKLLFEPMYGASQDIFIKILKSLKAANIFTIHSELNPGFGNINPEPIGENLDEAAGMLRQKGCELGICLDGDGDRIGALGEDGNYISSHHIFALVLWYLAARKKSTGKVIKTVTVSSIIERICGEFGLEVITTPVGFKYIGEKILEGGVIMGGEESGGLWAEGNIPERDGMIMALHLMEIICREGCSINRLLDGIYDRYGYFEYMRNDYQVSPGQKERLEVLLSGGIPEILKDAGVKKVETIDGYKYIIDRSSWVMIRLSGTEAVVRIYSEAGNVKEAGHLQDLGKKVVDMAIRP
ncbi:MAG: phosphoglucomutase/phosphomannomutase family protein [Actinobacteria bacterium]|nr:phosphoglucomutase/phosphomannomutase family protein [Actinomycetota bacterium]